MTGIGGKLASHQITEKVKLSSPWNSFCRSFHTSANGLSWWTVRLLIPVCTAAL